MRYLFLILTFGFSAQLEVEGNLSVNGTVNANGNPVTNVGVPTSLNDAINGNVLQDALRDDSQYEYEFYMINKGYGSIANDFGYWQMGISSSGNWNENFVLNILSVKLPQGWEIHNTTKLSNTSCNGSSCGEVILFTLRKPLEE